MTEKVPLKETALNAERIARIGREVHAECPEFDADAFVTSVMADLPRLELGARIARTSEGLHTYLPVTGSQALDVLLRSLPPTPEAAGVPNDFGLHTYSPHSHFVARATFAPASTWARPWPLSRASPGTSRRRSPCGTSSTTSPRGDDEGGRRLGPRRGLSDPPARERSHPSAAALRSTHLPAG
ncbi:hypothetical protein [Streptomyces kanamyceticus]|uniref:hypothetical protein n=1 Tax=Streptomyces kanamyceticus TaxID=1967 RepID=UPI0037DCCAE6